MRSIDLTKKKIEREKVAMLHLLSQLQSRLIEVDIHLVVLSQEPILRVNLNSKQKLRERELIKPSNGLLKLKNNLKNA
jgi:hypothetical protein